MTVETVYRLTMENGDPWTAWMQASGKVQAANVNWLSLKENHA